MDTTPSSPNNTTPPPSPKKPTSPLVIGLFGVIVILLGALGFAMSRASKKPNVAPSPSVAAPTASPEASASPEGSPKPASPSPTPGTSEPGEIVFGRSVDHMKLSGRTDSFAPGDALAYVATSPEPFSATTLEATLALRTGSDGERTLRRWDVEISGPENKQFSQSLSRADALIQSEEPGTYVLRLVRGGKTLCKGEFALKIEGKVAPEETIGADATPASLPGWLHYRSDALGVSFEAQESWTVKSGRDGDEAYASIRKGTPPISLKLRQNPPSGFDVQERDKREAFGREYKRVGRNSDRQFHGIPAKSWSFQEPSDSDAPKRILKYQFDQKGNHWEFSFVAPAADYDGFEHEVNEIIDRIVFD